MSSMAAPPPRARSRSIASSIVSAASSPSSPSSRLISSWHDHDPDEESSSSRTRILRATALIASITSALCAGSIAVFSLYGHIFQERLRYSQFQINGLAIGSSLALYLPVSALGYLCDRKGTAPLSALAAGAFAVGYGLAAVLYRRLESEYAVGYPRQQEQGRDLRNMVMGWSYPLMVFAFVCIGVGTCSMYLSAVATCAKNFGQGRHRGLALAAPIAAFGLSGMWISQVGSRVFYEVLPDGTRGDVDVFRFFVFLAVLLFVVGCLGIVALRVVGEDEIIQEAADELERSGLLDGRVVGYGALDDDSPVKTSVLNIETRSFLADHTMWLLALGFLLVTGPSEAFVNNLGTIIGTLTTGGPDSLAPLAVTSPATHVSIIGITSTLSRLATGTLTDMLAPSPDTRHAQLHSRPSTPSTPQRFAISRIIFLIAFALCLSVGLLVLASGLVQDHASRFWIVSGLVGAGYGAVFSLTPIVIAVIWGVENFATNWGVVAMFPALGATVWGVVYSAVYQRHAVDGFCYGKECYAATFWMMSVSVCVACGAFLAAWRGKGGWLARGVVV